MGKHDRAMRRRNTVPPTEVGLLYGIRFGGHPWVRAIALRISAMDQCETLLIAGFRLEEAVNTPFGYYE